MNIIHKSIAVFGLAAVAVSAFATIPANAQAPVFVRHPYKRAATMDRKAAMAASTGHYRKAAILRHRATNIRKSAGGV